MTPGSPNSEAVFTAGCTSQALSDKDLITCVNLCVIPGQFWGL